MATAITYEELKKANEAIATTNIKGKDYAQVNQRVKAFRMCYPQGFIRTQMMSNDGSVCVFKTDVGYYGENGGQILLGTGTAFEERSSSYINKASYIENCETSSVGRALGMAGFGIDTSICSAEELTNSISRQEQIKRDEDEAFDRVRSKAVNAALNGGQVDTQISKGQTMAPIEAVPTDNRQKLLAWGKENGLNGQQIGNILLDLEASGVNPNATQYNKMTPDEFMQLMYQLDGPKGRKKH